MTVEGDQISRCEVFDEADLDAALARFAQLSTPAPRLENAASHVTEHFWADFAARDWAALAEATADDIFTEDRRRVVNVGTRQGRDADMANLRAMAELNGNATATTIAIRGKRLVLSRLLMLAANAEGGEAFRAEGLGLTEIDAENRIAARITFDVDDIDAAFAELDARYLTGEASAHADVWSLIARNYAAFNGHEFPSAAPDWVTIDHRRGTSAEPGDLTAYIRSTWDVTPEFAVYIETVHRVCDLGAVITQVSKGTSQQGFEAEWREICVLMVDGELFSGCELFDEADLDTALTKFDELSRPPRLTNASTRTSGRLADAFNRRDLDGFLAHVGAVGRYEDRRKGLRHSLDGPARLQVVHSVFETSPSSWRLKVEPIAVRGSRLSLIRECYRDTDDAQQPVAVELLRVTQVGDGDLIHDTVAFDPDQMDAAFTELDARYLAGEAAAYAHTWSVVAHAYAALNRHEVPTATSDCVNVDHRRGIPFASDQMTEIMSSAWEFAPDICYRIEAVHRLSNRGAVLTHAANGASPEGFDAEWRGIILLTVEGDLCNRCELFEEADIDAALAKFDELNRPTLRLENTATQIDERFGACFAARDWDAMAEMLTDDTSTDDRRRIVNSGIRRGRDPVIASMQAISDVGVTFGTSAAIATRGRRLALSHIHMSSRDQGPEAFHIEMLGVVEINPDDRIVARVTFDLDDIDAAFAELDARYLAGEAAAHAHAWSAVAGAHVAFNRRELPTKAPELVDHRPLVTLEAGDPTSNVRDMWDFTPDLRLYIEAVHRLSDLGAVFTQVSHGTSQAGFDAEWRIVELVTVEGDLCNRCELFDEADIGAALARFDELSRPAPQLENATTQVYERFGACFAARDWDAISQLFADDYFKDDRRGVVNAGVRHGRDMAIVDLQAIADIGAASITSVAVATRGRRVALCRTRATASGPEAFYVEALQIVEIGIDQRIVAIIDFDLDDVDAGYAELDARYLAGEAAAHARTWSVISGAIAATNRHEGFSTTPDWVNINHHRATSFEPGELNAYIRSSWDDMPDGRTYIEAVHRLSDVGAVLTHTAEGTTQGGFEAQWRGIDIIMVEGDMVSHSEMFEEADLDAALARFDELDRPAPRLENAASQAYEHFWTCVSTRDWAALAELLSADIFTDDRRRVVNGGARHGRDAEIADKRVLVDLGMTNVTVSVVATRGERLALNRVRSSEFQTEVFNVAESDADDRIVAIVGFDIDDIDAAFFELDARYLQDEGAAHAHTWSLTMQVFAEFNRHDLAATTPDWVNIDHRRGIPFAPGDMIGYISALWDVAPDVKYIIRSVHRLNNRGAVVTAAGHGTSQQGFNAEWCEIYLLTFEGNQVSRCEVFHEQDIDAAVARFDELSAPAPQLENAANRTWASLVDAFNRRDLGDFVALTWPDGHYDDRRKGLRDSHDGSMRLRVAQTLFDLPPSWRLETEHVAIRGSRLCLIRQMIRDSNDPDRPITIELLTVLEVGEDGLAHTIVNFDPDDINGAMAELTSRWIASGEVAHPEVIESDLRLVEASNRHDWDAFAELSTGATYINHRQLAAAGIHTIAAHMSSIQAMASLVPDMRMELAEVLVHSASAALTHLIVKGTSADGVAIELPLFVLNVHDGGHITHMENFDVDQRDLALARFEELNRQI